MSIRTFVLQDIRAKIASDEKNGRRLAKARKTVEESPLSGGFTFTVVITPSDKRLKEVVVDKKGEIFEAVKFAEEEFKRVNEQTSIRAKYWVSVLVTDDVRVYIPESFFAAFMDISMQKR